MQLYYDNVSLYALLLRASEEVETWHHAMPIVLSWDGDTPLLAACLRGNMKLVQVLLENGASINKANDVSPCLCCSVTASRLAYIAQLTLLPTTTAGGGRGGTFLWLCTPI
eukprot:1137124-Pelagomonas_calceolata.AAC.1